MGVSLDYFPAQLSGAPNIGSQQPPPTLSWRAPELIGKGKADEIAHKPDPALAGGGFHSWNQGLFACSHVTQK